MIQAQPLYRYRVRYRRDVSSNRIYRVTVTAPDPDRARAYAALADPLFLATVETPRRIAQVIPEQADGLTAAKARDFR